MDVKLSLYSMSPWEDRIDSLLSLLNDASLFRPEKWGPSEPLRKTFTVDRFTNIKEMLMRRKGILFKNRKSRFWLSVEMFIAWGSGTKRPGRLSMGIDPRFFESPENIEAFLEFSAALFEWGEMLYGYVCHQEDFERKNVLETPTMIDGKLIKVGGVNVLRCLPGIYWANFFGNRYIEWFGEERIRSAPCYAVKSLKDGVLLLTDLTPLTYDRLETHQLESALRNHLGAEAFFDKSNPAKPCKSINS